MTARDHIIDKLGTRVVVGDRIAAAVNSWGGPALLIGTVENFTATRTTVRVETHTGYHNAVSVIDDSLKRFIKLPEVPA